MASVLPIPAMQDLKVTIQESTLVFPPQDVEEFNHQEKFIFSSNTDQVLNYDIPTAHFFTANPDFPPEIVAQRLKTALQKVLVPDDFMAGRFKLNQKSGRLEIRCNVAGAGFVVASSQYLLRDLGDFSYPNLGFRQLALQSQENLDDQPLCIFQCGSFVIGMSLNHELFDGIVAQAFIENLASQAFDDDEPSFAVIPCHSRHLLAARSPPRVEFPHPEFFTPDLALSLGRPAFDCEKDLDYRIFKLSSTTINYLEGKAAKDGGSRTAEITSFNVVAALVWRCKALTNDAERSEDRTSTLLNMIDIRSRLNPPLPASYCGNAVLVAYSSAKCGDIAKWAFLELVKMVSEGPTGLSDEYARSAIDWLEINKGPPCGEYMVSSWLRLRFDQVVYPWGKPVHSGPVVSHRKDICWIFPHKDGINALVTLPAREMEKFRACFHEFFP